MGLPIAQKGGQKREGGTLPAQIHYGRARLLYGNYLDTQKTRVKASNRIEGLVKAKLISEDEAKGMREEFKTTLLPVETKYLKESFAAVVEHHMAPVLKDVTAIGERFAVGLIAWIGSPHPGPHPKDYKANPDAYSLVTSVPGKIFMGIEAFGRISALWKFFGLFPRDGRLAKPVTGKTRDFSNHARVLAFLMGKSFVAQAGHGRGPYGALYYQGLNRLILRAGNGWECGVNHADKYAVDALNGCTLPHLKAQARILAVKGFLSDLWIVWREAEGLPISDPYIIEHGGPEHTMRKNLIRFPDAISYPKQKLWEQFEKK